MGRGVQQFGDEAESA